MDPNKKPILDNMLAEIKNNNPISDQEIIEQECESPVLLPPKQVDSQLQQTVPEQNMGLINQYKADGLRKKKMLEAQTIAFESQIEKLKHQAKAIERQSKVYWDAKSVDFSEGIKTYIQQSLISLENTRLDNRNQGIIDAYAGAYEKMQGITEGDYPDTMKQTLIEKIMAATEETVSRIENNTISTKYDLH